MLSACWANQSSVLPVMQRRGDARMAARTERAGLKGAVLAAGVLLLGLGPARANEPPRFEQLTAANVTRILQQAVVAARASSTPASVAVVDRVGNVLAVYVMNGAPIGIQVKAGRDRAAASRAGAVSRSRPTASWRRQSPRRSPARISPPAAMPSPRAPPARSSRRTTIPLSSGLEGGPLFGVQFSQLPCSDLSVRFATNNTDNPGVVDPTIGPKRSPLGFAGDPGGLPLYKNGTLVGGIGVFSDGVYGLARPKDAGGGSDEAIALAATTGFGAPEQIRANRIVVDGRTLTFTNSRRIGQWRPRQCRRGRPGDCWRIPGGTRATTMAGDRWMASPSGFGNREFFPTRTICSRATKRTFLPTPRASTAFRHATAMASPPPKSRRSCARRSAWRCKLVRRSGSRSAASSK